MRMRKEALTVFRPLPWVYHLRDALGVHMTLLAGDRSALLVDTGYGLYDPWPQIAALTPLPVTVVCTHAHHDHLLGSRWFSQAYLSETELPRCAGAVGGLQRERAVNRARELGLAITDDEARAYRNASRATFAPLRQSEFSLGGISARVIPMPGHTAGSIGLWVPEQRLLLFGDNLNPVVWLFWEDSLPLSAYVEQMRATLAIPFEYALCPHDDRLYMRHEVEAYVRGIDRDCVLNAQPVRISPYEGIATRSCSPAEGFTLVFDWEKVDGMKG